MEAAGVRWPWHWEKKTPAAADQTDQPIGTPKQRMLRTSLSSKKQMMEVAFICLQLQEGIKQPLCFKMLRR